MGNLPFVSCLVLGFLQFFSHKAQVFLVVRWPKNIPGRREIVVTVQVIIVNIIMKITFSSDDSLRRAVKECVAASYLMDLNS